MRMERYVRRKMAVTTRTGAKEPSFLAVAFGYYEALIHHGDLNRFGMEEARLKSIAPLMTQAGFNPTVIDDFADEAFDLLRELANAMAEGLDAGGLLVDKFNDDVVQNYIITYMRVRLSAEVSRPALTLLSLSRQLG